MHQNDYGWKCTEQHIAEMILESDSIHIHQSVMGHCEMRDSFVWLRFLHFSNNISDPEWTVENYDGLWKRQAQLFVC